MYNITERLKQEIHRLTQNNEELKIELKVLDKRIFHLTENLLITTPIKKIK